MKPNPSPYQHGRLHYLGGTLWLPLLLPPLLLWGGGCAWQQAENPDGDTFEADGVAEEEGEVPDPCRDTTCPLHALCDPDTGECRCVSGYEPLGGRCVAGIEDGDSADDDTADPQEHGEIIEDEAVAEGADKDADTAAEALPEEEGDSDQTSEEIGDDDREGLPPCPIPQAPTLTIIHQGATLAFISDAAGSIQVGTALSPAVPAPDAWLDQDSLLLEHAGIVTVFARLMAGDCEPQPFAFAYDVRETYPPSAGKEGTTAVPMDDPSLIGWATGVASITYGAHVEEAWRTPDKALGPAAGTAFDVVCLGDGGDITLLFDPPIADGPGYDFAVFENSFSDTFLEVAHVDISSDGVVFLRFDSAYLGESSVGGFGNHDAALFDGLGGKYRQGFGNPFDLRVFTNRPEVRDGVTDLGAIRYVRITDIVGDGSAQDSFGHVIYDPHPTADSAGFDLDAVGVLHQASGSTP